MPIETPQPEYRQVAAELRLAIRSGEFRPGSQLPSEPELAERFGTTRATINRALSVLRTEGLIKPERGRGTTVNKLPVIRRATIGRQAREAREESGARGAFAAELQRLGLTPRSDVTLGEVSAPAEVAELFEDPDLVLEGATLFARRRVMFAENVPVQLATSYLPLDVASAAQLTQEDTGPGGAYSRLADVGLAPARFRELVRVRTPDDAEARALDLDADHRVYDITRIARTVEDRVIEVNRIVLPAHQWELDTEWEA
ncbi:MAG: GntR family transcriptional regulator [Streptosporangiaceae bacterium]